MNRGVGDALSQRGVHAASGHEHPAVSPVATITDLKTPGRRTPSPLNEEAESGEAVRATSLAPPGYASLEIQLVAGKSAVTSSYATNPLKLLTPRARGQSVWAYTSSFGGGLVAGDQTRLDLRIGLGARCFLGTQASTKIYRNPAALPSGHETCAMLEAGSLLVFAPDPIQAFAGSTYSQRQDFHLGPDASLVLLDWLTAGRVARGERWECSRLASRNEVFIDKRCVFLDSLLLSSDDGDLGSNHRLGRFNCVATLLLLGPAVRDFASQLLEQISKEPVTCQANLIASASPVAGGAVLRVAGEHIEAIGHELHSHLAVLRDSLGDDPWARKW